MTPIRFVMAAGTFSDVDVEREHLAGLDVELRVASLATPQEVARATADADGIIVTIDPLPAAHIAALGPRVRVIGRAGIGLDAIDLEAAAAHGVAVVHAPDYATEEVATHALALLLAAQRRILQGDALAREHWGEWRRLAPVRPLSELTAGVIGCGRIGRAVIELLAPLVARVLAYDPFVTQAPTGCELAPDVPTLLREADLLSLHMPLTPETTGLIDERALASMKPDAIVVNVSRGGLIDQPALARALSEGRLGGAGLDVLAAEPPAADDPILSAPNAILTPHFAWYSTASERRARTTAVDAMLDYLAGAELRAGRIAARPAAA
jgi:D-3-phosphoglycerate dehydrogenase